MDKLELGADGNATGNTAESYAVNLHGHGSCECMGHLRHGRCKHLACACPTWKATGCCDERRPAGDHLAGLLFVAISHIGRTHNITMYYPMRAVRTRKYKYIRNLAHKLDYPFASDLHDSSSWQGILKRGDKTMGKRTVEQFVHRPLEELYDLEKDPDELKNLAGSAGHAKELAALRKKVRDWQERTGDPWVIKYQHE